MNDSDRVEKLEQALWLAYKNSLTGAEEELCWCCEANRKALKKVLLAEEETSPGERPPELG